MESEFYSNWVFYNNDEEKKEAETYLILWKKFLLKKVSHLEQVGPDQLVDRLNLNDTGISTLGLKIELKNKVMK